MSSPRLLVVLLLALLLGTTVPPAAAEQDQLPPTLVAMPGAFGSLSPGITPGETPAAAFAFLPMDLWPTDETHAAATSSATTGYAFGGDVDGDGLADAIVVTTWLSGRTIVASEIAARSSADGRTLWTFAFGENVGWLAYDIGDANGDGIGELAFVTYEGSETIWVWPPPGFSGFVEDFTYLTQATRRLVLVDGATGAEEWSASQATRTLLAGRYLPQVGYWAQAQVILDLHHNTVVERVDDLDGDGIDEILWQPWDLAFTNAQNTRTTHVLVFDGAAGSVVWRRELVGTVPSASSGVWGAMGGAYREPTVASVTTGPDINGDGVRDLFSSQLHSAPDGTARLTRAALDTRTGAPIWVRAAEPTGASGTAPVGGFERIEPSESRLLWTLGGLGNRPLSVEMLDASTGRTLWTREMSAPQAVAMPAGDTNADSSVDLLVATFHHEGPTAIGLASLDGTTGATLWTRALAYEMEEWNAKWATIWAPRWDHDGDGALDLLAWQGRTDPTGLTEKWSLISMADGRDLWTSTRSEGREMRYHFSVPDLDGDGLADIFQAGVEQGAESSGLRIAALTGASGTPLWTRDAYRESSPGGLAWNLRFDVLGEANGAPGADLIVGTWGTSWQENAPYRLELLDGATGAAGTGFEGGP